MALLNFDATQVEPEMGAIEPIPEGWYNAMIDMSDLKPTKNGDGAYLELRFNVMDGAFSGRKVFARLNIRNANETAQRIAHGQLSAIAHAVNVLQVNDSQMLHNIPLKIKVKLVEGGVDATGAKRNAQNEISGFRNINETIETVQTAPVAVATPAPVAIPAPIAVPAPATAGWAAPAVVAQPAPVTQPIPAPVAQPAPVAPAPVAPAILGGAPQQAWATTPPPVQTGVAPDAQPAPAPATEAPAPAAAFDPNQPPAWMTK